MRVFWRPRSLGRRRNKFRILSKSWQSSHREWHYRKPDWPPDQTRTYKIHQLLFQLIQRGIWILKYSNHLNTRHPNTGLIWIPDSMSVLYSNGFISLDHFILKNLFVYIKWSSLVVTWLSWPLKNRTKLSGIQMPFEYWTIRQPDMFGPFEYRTSPVFGWLL